MFDSCCFRLTWGIELNISRRKETVLVFLCISIHGDTCKLESLLLVYVARLIFFNLITMKEYQRYACQEKLNIKDIGLFFFFEKQVTVYSHNSIIQTKMRRLFSKMYQNNVEQRVLVMFALAIFILVMQRLFLMHCLVWSIKNNMHCLILKRIYLQKYTPQIQWKYLSLYTMLPSQK